MGHHVAVGELIVKLRLGVFGGVFAYYPAVTVGIHLIKKRRNVCAPPFKMKVIFSNKYKH